MAKPFVSVLIDTYNHEKFIEQAIASVLEQNFPASDYEILVVDDGSTDRTPELVKRFAPRVTYLAKENGGQASAFNYGIPRCRGEIVAFLDGDDWWEPNKLAAVTEAMKTNPDVGIVGNGLVIVQPDGTEERELLLQGKRFRADTPFGAKLFRVRGSFLGTSRMTIRANVLAEIGVVPEIIFFEADEYLFTLAAVFRDALILPECLTYYRLHEGNLYQTSVADPVKDRRKQAVLQSLSASLVKKLTECKVDPRAARIITNNVRADADLLRLSMDGGMPWESFQTEWWMYQRVLEDASVFHRVFKLFTLVPSLLLPPRLYFSWKRRIAGSSRYKNLRNRWLPNPVSDRVSRSPHSGEPPQQPAVPHRPRG